MKKLFKLGVIGCGNMANAIISGAILNANVLKGEQIIVYDANKDRANDFAKKIGGTVAVSNRQLVDSSEYILLAIKPQSFSDVVEELCNAKFIISIMAGVKTKTIFESIPDLERMVRIMPNAPAMVGKGMSALYFVNATENDRTFVKSIFSSVGKIVEMEENKMDAVTAISGSGPAYIYYFIKSIIDAGVNIGLTEEESKILTFQTFFGATEFAAQSDLSLDQLIDMVCSKGGTTIEAIKSLQNDNTDKIVEKAIQKCYSRSKELSRDK